MRNIEEIAEKLSKDSEGLALPNNVDFEKYYEANSEDKQSVKPIHAFFDDLEAHLEKGDLVDGAKLPFAKTIDKFGFRAGEVTMWSGYNSHKKSMMLGFCSLNFLHQRERVCIASFEMKPVSTIIRLAKQFTGGMESREEEIAELMAYAKNNYFIFDRLGGINPKRLYGVIVYCAKELKVKHFIIDSLMRVVGGEDDYNAQKDFVVKLCDLAMALNIHIHLVHHVRDGDETKVPNRYQAKGSKAISDNVHNSLIVWSNKQNLDDQPDVILKCDKQRNGEWEGSIAIDFNKQNLQFTQKDFENHA